ncbi:MAG TPA: ATP-binding SpoIIE family protein phosphatase [Bdellovibrionota bacterium]|nr:ATP-binding SpoIIE family protein phosphatase [Bdellovibrionota bacterium]
MRAAICLKIQEGSQVGEARRTAQALATSLGFSESEAGKVSIIVTEAASNLVKHAGPAGGEILLQPVTVSTVRGMDILALDRGPGIQSISQSIRDGYSTAGTQGIGLGGIRRLSAEFDLYSQPGQGVALFSRVWAVAPPEPRSLPFQVGGLTVPMRGEVACGDGWDYHLRPDGVLEIAVADGLGHGLFASEAAQEALRVFRERKGDELPTLLSRSNDALKKTRGAALALLKLDPKSKMIRYVGIGNIASAIVGSTKSQSLVSMNGIVGHECRKIQEFSYAYETGSLIIMHSDGLGSRWDLASYPGIQNRNPVLIAGVLYRDFSRHRDDVTVVVARQELRRPGTLAA